MKIDNFKNYKSIFKLISNRLYLQLASKWVSDYFESIMSKTLSQIYNIKNPRLYLKEILYVLTNTLNLIFNLLVAIIHILMINKVAK